MTQLAKHKAVAQVVCESPTDRLVKGHFRDQPSPPQAQSTMLMPALSLSIITLATD